MLKKWRVVLIEDEIQVRAFLKNLLLTRYHDIDVVGEAATVHQALVLFNTLPVIEGVFIDIHLENDGMRSGLDLAFNLNQRHQPPWIIFTTAYDYAVTAVNDVHPIAYLLKPLDVNKLDAALHYMRKVCCQDFIISAAFDNEAHLEIRHTVSDKSGDKEKCRCFIKPADIVYVRKNSNVSSIHIRLINGKLLDGIHGTLSEWQKKLTDSYFIQIHRSHIANIQQAQSIHAHPFSKETYQLSFKCCVERLTIGGGFYEQVVEKLQYREHR